MKKVILYIITIFIFIICVLVTLNVRQITNHLNRQTFKHYSFTKNTVTTPITSIYTLTPTITAVKSLAHAKQSIRSTQVSVPQDIAKSATGLTVLKKDKKNIDVYFEMTNGKKSFIRFENKSNGTWNLRGWYLSRDNQIPSNKTTSLAGNTSDWEYVLRVTDKVNTEYQFSGGSHYNEKLQSIELFDNEKDTKFSLNIGQKVDVSKLKIIENTYLTMNNSTKYAAVKRTYIISPSRIDLYTDFNFIKDVFVGTSYICMLPTNKTYGRNIKFIDTGSIYNTPAYGTTLTTNGFENFIGKEKTLSVEIWGDTNPSYKCTVGIQNEYMVDKFQNELKVFYWDFNKNSNKLYFSKYDSKDYTLISKGTKWSNHAFWEYRIDD